MKIFPYKNDFLVYQNSNFVVLKMPQRCSFLLITLAVDINVKLGDVVALADFGNKESVDDSR